MTRTACHARGAPDDALPPAGATPRATLDIYFVDVEGGRGDARSSRRRGESFLVDTGWGGANGRDAKRIMAVAREAGIAQIDYLLITHFHSDHDGGAPELSRLIPIRTFVDYGEATEKGKKVQEPFDAYARRAPEGGAPRAESGRPAAAQGSRRPDRSAAAARRLSEPLSGARPGQPGVSRRSREKANDFTGECALVRASGCVMRQVHLPRSSEIWCGTSLVSRYCPEELARRRWTST